jgi:predicted alpha/beta-fold hydrolase
VVAELSNVDGLEHIWLIGYSMGGNLVLKAAGEAGSSLPALRGVLAVCPNIDPSQCVDALAQPQNRLYHNHFLSRLKARMKRKASLFPGKWDLTAIDRIATMREFDDRYTAPDGGYSSGRDYYDRAGARHVLSQIVVPTVIITSQNDPFIPYRMFTQPDIQRNRAITVVAPIHGGHCGFLQRRPAHEDSYWAENRIVEIMTQGGAERMRCRS